MSGEIQVFQIRKSSFWWVFETYMPSFVIYSLLNRAKKASYLILILEYCYLEWKHIVSVPGTTALHKYGAQQMSAKQKFELRRQVIIQSRQRYPLNCHCVRF